MTTLTAARVEVDPPPLEPPTYGLLSVARLLTEEGRWQVGGVEYATDACVQGDYTTDRCGTPGDDAANPPDDGDGCGGQSGPGLNWVHGSKPFTFRARAECNAVGFDDPSGVALRRLRLVEHREVERFFSTHVLGRQEARLPLGTEPAPLLTALGALEHHAYLHYAGLPTLHAPRWTQPYFTAHNSETAAGPVLRTRLGSRLAFGAYDDDPSRPAAPDPRAGQFWLFATGTVTARRSASFVHEVFDPPSNRRLAVAQRLYALDWDCYLAAAPVTVARGEC